MPPKMSKLLKNQTLSFNVLYNGSPKFKNVKVYFKVNDQDYIATLGNRKFTSILAEFISFDKNHSKLIPATINQD